MPTDFSDAVAAVQGFLHAALDLQDGDAAKAYLTRESLAAGTFELPPELKGAKFTLGPPEETDKGLFIPVALTDAAGVMTQQLPFAPTLEDGVWKLDMNRMMERLMGGSMEALANAMGDAMGQAMGAVGEALSGAMGALSGDSPAAAPPAAPKIDDAVLQKFQTENLARAVDELKNRNDIEVPLDIDYATLLTGADEAANARLLSDFASSIVAYLPYALNEANQKFPLADRVSSFRIEGFPDEPGETRAVFAEGPRLVYRLSLTAKDGYYNGSDLATQITGVAAGMSDERRPDAATRTGPSFRPTGDDEKIVTDYRELIFPAVQRRIGEIIGHDLPIEVMWSSLESAHAKNLWVWGLNRLVGALALLAANPVNVPALAELKSITVTIVDYAEGKSLHYNVGDLTWYFSPKDGEPGNFTEQELADALSGFLKLRTRPIIAELEKYCTSWEQQLRARFLRPIKYSIDFEGFTAPDDEGKNVFALTLLREHGIDRLFYAITNLADKNPNFAQQLPQRIAWLRIENAFSNEKKSLHGEQTCIVYRLFCHEGYKGYLLPKEVEKLLPEIVAAMPDINWDTPADDPREGPSTDYRQDDPDETEELKTLQALEDAHEHDGEEIDHDAGDPREDRYIDPSPPTSDPRSQGPALTDVGPYEDPNDRAPQPYQPDPAAIAAAAAAAFTDAQAQFQAILPAYAQQFSLLLGKPVEFDIDWNSLDKTMESFGLLLNACLTPTLGGLSILISDPVRKLQAHTLISRVSLRQTRVAAEHGFSFNAGTLRYSAVLTPPLPPMDPQLASSLLGIVLNQAASSTPINPA